MTACSASRKRWLGVALVGVVSVLAGAPGAHAIHRGFDAPMSNYGFMVSLRLADTPDSPRCGGTLIEPDIVLTAAHCVARVPQGGLVVVVGVDVERWPSAARVRTLAHSVPQTYGTRFDSRHDIAVIRLAEAQTTPTVRLASREPRVGARVVTAGWGCTNAPPVCRVRATTLQASPQTVLRDALCGRNVFWRPPYHAHGGICTKGVMPRSTVNRGDSGGPLLVRGPDGSFVQVGVTALGSDSATRLYAGFTSIPLESAWLASTIERLHAG